ncbi:hypothetical protein GLOTRDRAFT_50043, partial [Gloeophyllum trabeum ATCC 11539]
SVFRYISSFPDSNPAPRDVIPKEQVLVPDEYHTLGFPEVRPDISVMDRGLQSKLWRHRAAFGEVKWNVGHGPDPPQPGRVSVIVTQAAGYARLHMSARPFSLFSVALLIFGTRFCVGIFDRNGVVLSPTYEMFAEEGLKKLIGVVRNLTHVLTDVDLGRDPTVDILDSDEAERLTGVSNPYPLYRISPIGQDNRSWCTIGPPVWSSISLLGRGTLIFRVREYHPGTGQGNVAHLGDQTMVMKTAWRDSGRNSESSIYQSITASHPGLAQFLIGEDVITAGGATLTVDSVRGNAAKLEDSPVLHRLILRSVGRPLWEYNSDLELLKGWLAALNAHEFLSSRKVLHRDVSPGNILLAADPEKAEAGSEGFLSDLEYAHIQDILETKVEVIEREPVKRGRTAEDKAKRGAPLTGTRHFMSSKLLSAVGRGSPTKHVVEDDIESFVWSLGYAVMRKAVTATNGNKDEKEAHELYMTSFKKAFSHLSAQAILDNRKSTHSPVAFARLPELDSFIDRQVSVPLQKLLRALQQRMRKRTIYEEDEQTRMLRPEQESEVAALLGSPTDALDTLSLAAVELSYEFLRRVTLPCIQELESHRNLDIIRK